MITNVNNKSSDSNNNNDINPPEEYVNKIPFFIRFVLITKTILFIINIFSNYISFYLSNLPFYTINRYQFWRLITTTFITTNIINMIIGFIVWMKTCISLERSIGTIRYILIFISNSIFINLLYCGIFFLVKLVFQSNQRILGFNYFGIYKVNNNGIWSIIIFEMTILCLNNPNAPITFLSKPFPIRAKFYPIFIILIYTLINNFRISYGVICGFLYGVIYYAFFQNKIYISNNLIIKIENSICCRCLNGVWGFISCESIKNNSFQSNRDIPIFESGQHGFSPFQGKGISLGGSNDYIAVHEQKQDNTLDGIKNTDNKE
jgi:membrane associated rhomboid family serine protease